jgi:hypothetical protein
MMVHLFERIAAASALTLPNQPIFAVNGIALKHIQSPLCSLVAVNLASNDTRYIVDQGCAAVDLPKGKDTDLLTTGPRSTYQQGPAEKPW